MLFRALADLVAVSHLGFIIFVLFGGLLTLWRRWFRWVHIPALTWAVALEFFAWSCPLTPLENWLRQAGGSAGYSGGFIERYLMPIIYPGEFTRELQLILGWLVIGVNLLVYLAVWRRLRTRSPES